MATSTTNLSPSEGQAMVDAVAAQIRQEHSGFPAYRFKKTVGNTHYYEAPASKNCLLCDEGAHSKKKISYFTVDGDNRDSVTLCCWSQKCKERVYPVSGVADVPKWGTPREVHRAWLRDHPRRELAEDGEPRACMDDGDPPFWIYTSADVLDACMEEAHGEEPRYSINKSPCCVAKFRDITGTDYWTVPILAAMCKANTDRCCGQFDGHVEQIIAKLWPW